MTVGLTSLVGMRCTLREHKLYCTLGERNNVMLHGLEALDMFVDAVFTQTDLAAVTELLDRFGTKVTGYEFLCLAGGSGHFFSYIVVISEKYKVDKIKKQCI